VIRADRAKDLEMNLKPNPEECFDADLSLFLFELPKVIEEESKDEMSTKNSLEVALVRCFVPVSAWKGDESNKGPQFAEGRWEVKGADGRKQKKEWWKAGRSMHLPFFSTDSFDQPPTIDDPFAINSSLLLFVVSGHNSPHLWPIPGPVFGATMKEISKSRANKKESIHKSQNDTEGEMGLEKEDTEENLLPHHEAVDVMFRLDLSSKKRNLLSDEERREITCLIHNADPLFGESPKAFFFRAMAELESSIVESIRVFYPLEERYTSRERFKGKQSRISQKKTIAETTTSIQARLTEFMDQRTRAKDRLAFRFDEHVSCFVVCSFPSSFLVSFKRDPRERDPRKRLRATNAGTGRRDGAKRRGRRHVDDDCGRRGMVLDVDCWFPGNAKLERKDDENDGAVL